MIKGTRSAPQFELDCGITLDLKPIAGLILNRWRIEYQKRTPEPDPPKKILENGEEWYDVKDVVYLRKLELWQAEHNQELAQFMYANGVLTLPPDDFQPIFSTEDPREIKVQWVMSLLTGSEEIIALSNAISGLTEATPEGIEEAEKK